MSGPAPQATPLEALHPAEWNPRSIKDERFQNLCRSIEADPEFLWRRPVLAQVDGTIYAGNMRYRAAQHLGMETIPAIVEEVPDQLARERALRDNAQWGDWAEDDLAKTIAGLRDGGSELDLLGFDDSELQALLNKLANEGGLTDPDDVPPLPDEPTTKPGDLWLLGDHRILCGDSTNPHDVAVVMRGEKAKLLATDPPYLVDYVANHPEASNSAGAAEWDTYSGAAEGVRFYIDFLQAAFPHLADRCPVYQWHANLRQSVVAEAWDKTGLLLHQVIIWVKTHGTFGRSHYRWQHEPCSYGWKQGRMPNLKPSASETTVWHVEQKGESDEDHPTQKPVELFRRPILSHTKPGDLCFEPFLGSGTCLMAAEVTGRRCFAIEREPRYVDQAIARWEGYSGQKAIRVEKED